MGQVQSEVASIDDTQGDVSSATGLHSSQSSTSIEARIEEALAHGNDEKESLDGRAYKALECPCIADLCSGSCGVQFSEAFLCFLESTAEEKGSDCVHRFVALQNCMKANPNAFSKASLALEGVGKEMVVAQDCKIIPPAWSQDSSSSLRDGGKT